MSDLDLALAAAGFLALPLDPDHRPGVVANLALLRTHAERIMAAPLAPELDPAPVFAA